MAVSSMTGFASADGALGSATWLWEMRSVNGKGLDIRLRLPSGYEKLEPDVKSIAGKFVKRGNIQISLNIKQETSSELVINQAALDQVLKVADQFSENPKIASPSLDGILNIRGVLEEKQIAQSEDEKAELGKELVASFENCMKSLAEARQSEGESLKSVLLDQVDQIEGKLSNIVADPSRSQEAIRTRLKEQVANLIEINADFDEARLHAEAALLATKADLQEEIDRLNAHIHSARSLINEGGVVGRRLDFLAQEFNRECNTICSKSNSSDVTANGLDLKVIIDQFREQIQNVE